ncbi:hypothetical protein A7985_01130 [Pseudoalteromonas luteoviolacea]|uniref:ATP-grasp domain-containing protein n=1 Tax=Pseudoalteromonas luteoviolacea TaxID=43657 RepID=A0A1C0TTE3_9GAMM|nr:hypothetical protein [Pseudoalteromonas luteoviolacea]OCQ22599.1 hypothetical protein A7985_01130 [Pseudoalteromonas luteoviolacea]
MKPVISIVTHQDAPQGVADDKILAAELTKRGVHVQFAVWNDYRVNWSLSDLALVRSTWDYHLQPTTWHQWIKQVSTATKLVNSAELQLWNSNKSYLLELVSKGINVIPTRSPSTVTELLKTCNENDWHDVVIKPSIGASAFGAKRFNTSSLSTEGAVHFNELVKRFAVILQPYQKAVETERERSLVYINQSFSHAFSKPAFHSELGNQLLEAHQALPDEQKLAKRVLDALPECPLIARIDLLPSEFGPKLMEVELIEPELALHFSDKCTSMLADALMEEVRAV